MEHIKEAYLQIPPITRAYSTICVLTTLAVQLEFVNELQLYFNPTLTFRHFQLWRVITTFCFFGRIGFNFLLNIIFIYQYCRMLEENSFRRRSADFLLMFIFGGVIMLIISIVEGTVFLGHALTIMIVYVWSRRNPFVRMSFFGVFTFQAPYLPWVLVAFSFLLGNGIRIDVIGIAVGHVYYFLEDVLPNRINGFKVLKTPKLIKDLIDGPIHDANYDPLPEAERPGGFNWRNDG